MSAPQRILNDSLKQIFYLYVTASKVVRIKCRSTPAGRTAKGKEATRVPDTRRPICRRHLWPATLRSPIPGWDPNNCIRPRAGSCTTTSRCDSGWQRPLLLQTNKRTATTKLPCEKQTNVRWWRFEDFRANSCVLDSKEDLMDNLYIFTYLLSGRLVSMYLDCILTIEYLFNNYYCYYHACKYVGKKSPALGTTSKLDYCSYCLATRYLC